MFGSPGWPFPVQFHADGLRMKHEPPGLGLPSGPGQANTLRRRLACEWPLPRPSRNHSL